MQICERHWAEIFISVTSCCQADQEKAITSKHVLPSQNMNNPATIAQPRVLQIGINKFIEAWWQVYAAYQHWVR